MKINKQKQNDDKKKKDLNVPLVKLKEQPTSLPAMWNRTCLCQRGHYMLQYAVQTHSQSCAAIISMQIFISTQQYMS